MSNDITYGIAGYKAHEFLVDQWIDGNGMKTGPIKLWDLDETFKVIYCFQSWCPGCHSRGFPALKEMVEELKDSDKVKFLAIQTVFEGHDTNTHEKLIETQKQYDIKIPFGHDPGDESSNNRSQIMYHYRTGGTPWFIFIDQRNNVVFNDFHLNIKAAIEFLKTQS
ncbi:thiol-disulfide isomerase [Flavobacteriales bacterium 34_180_T64]|nr:thiol-disulfide isomerase [Flavobacteriales bacterium 34_180_T64]